MNSVQTCTKPLSPEESRLSFSSWDLQITRKSYQETIKICLLISNEAERCYFQLSFWMLIKESRHVNKQRKINDVISTNFTCHVKRNENFFRNYLRQENEYNFERLEWEYFAFTLRNFPFLVKASLRRPWSSFLLKFIFIASWSF